MRMDCDGVVTLYCVLANDMLVTPLIWFRYSAICIVCGACAIYGDSEIRKSENYMHDDFAILSWTVEDIQVDVSAET
jgi:hypothetical protein